MQDIEVVVAHSERVTIRVGEVFLKIDTDQSRIDREVEVMARVPIPTPTVLWRQPPVLALAAVAGAALGVLNEPSPASSAAWVAAGRGDAMYDLATLTLAHEEHLDDVIAGYGGDIDIDVIRAYWSLRSLMEIRWLAEHGYGAPATFPEVAVLKSLAATS